MLFGQFVDFSMFLCLFPAAVCLQTMEALKNRIFICPGSIVARNGVCKLYNAIPLSNGYISLSFRHPVSGKVTNATVQRVAVMVHRGTFNLPKDLDASHLCHNKTCTVVEHISIEPRHINSQRRRCVQEGQCLGHGHFPECLLHLHLSSEQKYICLSFFFVSVGSASTGVSEMAEASSEVLNSDKPFFLYVPFHAVHSKVVGRKDLTEKYRKRGLNERLAEYASMIELLDQNIGKINRAIKDPNGDGDVSDDITNNTIFIVYSDNGGLKDNKPLTGKKGTLTEGGIRVPLIFRYPGVIKANTITNQSEH